mmetsp:Transcript_50637/g.107906  ORF Transcript_50637/g.107906 Transcript_50637/m.107906 type:complete len:132 (+) Transcript_50637:81-476(+)
MDLTYEMYHADFDVFGYDAAIEQRPDLTSPKKNRRAQLGAMKFDQFSRNSYLMSNGQRASHADLFHSATREERLRMLQRSSTMALRQSLVGMNKDEILASVAGIRHISFVREESSESAADGESRRSSKKDD